MNAKQRNQRKRIAIMLSMLPLAACAVFSASQAHAGTIVASGFSPKVMQRVLLQNEQSLFSKRTGTVTATCGGNAMSVSQTLPLYKLNARLITQCPNRGLRVTLTNNTRTDNGAAILNWK